MQRKSCRRGRHAFGVGVPVGGGIVRRICKYCSAVQIELGNRHIDPEYPRALFRPPRRLSIFSIGSALSYIPSGPETSWSVDELS